MTYEEWLQHGIDNNYVDGVCLMHNDRAIFTDEEEQAMYEDWDPCIARYVVRPPACIARVT